MNATNETITVKVLDIVPSTTSNSDGYLLFAVIDSLLSKGNSIAVSFKDVPALSSSFLNSSIGSIIEKYGYNSLKSRMKMTNFSKSNADIVKRYLVVFQNAIK